MTSRPEAASRRRPGSRPLLRWLRLILWPVSLAVAVLVASLWLGQRRLIYLPGGDVPPVEQVAPDWDEVTLTAADGVRLGAWYADPEPGAPVVVVFHGNAGNRADRATLGSELAASGLGILLVDYRGYGGNPGSPSEAGLALDARAASQFVRSEAAEHPVVLFGESLGAAVAVELATTEPPAALVLRSPFTSLAAVAAVHYPWIPGQRLLLRDRYPSGERIAGIGCPLLVIAGDRDSIVPFDQSQELYELATEPKELVVVAGADHNDPELVSGPDVIAAVVRFTREATGG